MEKKLKLIKETILNVAKKYNIEIDKIILFGSRARGDYKEDSDWDLLIVTKEKISNEIKIALIVKLKIIFARLNIPNDIIIKSADELYEERRYSYTISSVALNEGILI